MMLLFIMSSGYPGLFLFCPEPDILKIKLSRTPLTFYFGQYLTLSNHKLFNVRYKEDNKMAKKTKMMFPKEKLEWLKGKLDKKHAA